MYILYRIDLMDPDTYILHDTTSDRCIFTHLVLLTQSIKALPLYGWIGLSEIQRQLFPTYTFNSLDDIPELFI